MRAKAINDLVQLQDKELFETVAEGLGYILSNAKRLYEGSKQLRDQKHFHASIVLRNIGQEEAAKFLILVDAIRCPRQPAELWSRQFRRFNDHLAKGLYSKACYWHAVTLDQLQDYLDSEREDFYLDGPTGIDWIFRNDVLQRREETLYVDYIETEEGHSWLNPGHLDNEIDSFLLGHHPMALGVSEALASCGVGTAQGLEVIAEVWRPVTIQSNMTRNQLEQVNRRTLRELERKGILPQITAENSGYVQRYWQFPMYGLDLSPIKVDRVALRARQQRNFFGEF